MSPLTNEAIEQIAERHVLGRYGRSVVPERLFVLDDPDGSFFAIAAPPSERHRLRVMDVGVLGDAGFFVYRLDGTIRQFDPGDFTPAFAKAPSDAADRKLVAAVLEALRHIS